MAGKSKTRVTFTGSVEPGKLAVPTSRTKNRVKHARPRDGDGDGDGDGDRRGRSRSDDMVMIKNSRGDGDGGSGESEGSKCGWGYLDLIRWQSFPVSLFHRTDPFQWDHREPEHDR